MPMERMSMRHVRDCVRLKNAGMSTREIARRVGVASSTVRLTLRRCEVAGIAWPLDAGLTDAPRLSDVPAEYQRRLTWAGRAIFHRTSARQRSSPLQSRRPCFRPTNGRSVRPTAKLQPRIGRGGAGLGAMKL
jgi:transposase-like protein